MLAEISLIFLCCICWKPAYAALAGSMSAGRNIVSVRESLGSRKPREDPRFFKAFVPSSHSATCCNEFAATFGVDVSRYILYRVVIMETFQEVIDAWSSTKALASDIGTSDSHVRTMRARDSIPPGFWAIVVEKAGLRGHQGITLEALAAVAKAKRDVA